VYPQTGKAVVESLNKLGFSVFFPKEQTCCGTPMYLTGDKETTKFEYLSLRYESKSTIITSNLIFSEWIKIFQDKVLTMALLDRLTHNAIILNMNGESYRRRKIEN